MAQDAKNAFPDDAARLSGVMNAGDFGSVITQTTEIMHRAGVSDSMLIYLRGMAEWRLSWFDDSLNDLKPLGDFGPKHGWPDASKIVDQITEVKALVPPNVEEIKDADHVLFRVYYDEDNDWTKAVRKLLPTAFTIDSQLYKSQIYKTSVFIFKDPDAYSKFSSLLFTNKMVNWAWASGSDGVLMFCPARAADNAEVTDTGSDYFKGTVVHEFSHALLHRLISNTDLPIWLDEGFAVYAQSRIMSDCITYNDTVMKRCFADDTLLSLSDMTRMRGFDRAVEKQFSNRKKHADKPESGKDGYEQAFSMVRYLLLTTTPEQRQQFIKSYNDSKKFDDAFSAVFGIKPDDFYAAWKVAAAKGLPVPAAP